MKLAYMAMCGNLQGASTFNLTTFYTDEQYPIHLKQNISGSRPRFVKVPEGWLCNPEEVKRSVRPPPHDCPDCQIGYYSKSEQHAYSHSYHHSISDTSAANTASAYVKEAQESRKHITNRLSSYVDLLMSRWRKRSQDQRRELLNKAVPELEEPQWINSRYGYSEEKFRFGERTMQRRRHLLVPWLNVKVLKTSPAVLFALLHHRTLYPPEDFAPLDCRQMKLSWASGNFDVVFSAKYVVMSGSRYGDLVVWNAQQTHTGCTLGFPRARLVHEAQAFLMNVLSRITDAILDSADTASASTRTDKWRTQTSTGFRHTGIDAQGRGDFDHLTDLQCDPAYLRRYIKGLFSITIFRVADEVDASRMVAQYIYMEYQRYYSWYWIEVECKHARDLHAIFADSTHPGQPIRPKYNLALGALELLLVNQLLERTKRFKFLIPWAPEQALHYSLSKKPGMPLETVVRGVSRHSNLDTEEALENGPLDCCLHQMMRKPDNQRQFDHAMLFAMIDDHLAQNNRKEAARIDEFLMRELADISALHESLISLRLNRPRNTFRVIYDVFRTKKREVWRYAKDKPKDHSKQEFKETGKPLWTASTKEKLPAILRGFLEGYFKDLGNLVWKDLQGTGLEVETIEETLGAVLVQNKPEYLEAIAREEEEIITKIIEVEKSTPDTSETQAQRHRTSQREKVKTRPDSLPESVQLADTPESIDTARLSIKPAKRIQVAPRTLDVVHLMYPDAQSKPRNITWDDFVHALCDAGFVASNNGGSAVRFEVGSGGDFGEKGAIIFHKPHPVLKVDPAMLHGMGRLAEWFGWTRDRFTTECAQED
ncbi:hypothetical protein BDP55DRAFT_716232 [Colletotrichum godetiae]|uniref:Uncharacterized protein n=1 Tax=Colletotrichum godetiae TaxID=1209918 RepID=A0AAJ0AK59_9PEZI|nr:uncharacterized protein BDP55DRAFT_716232 [Colletotrichum godetiae]KAK1674804.1 hypothetical protein BDP55DRAFT_716232 [Colletotrichum godetiae]